MPLERMGSTFWCRLSLKADSRQMFAGIARMQDAAKAVKMLRVSRPLNASSFASNTAHEVFCVAQSYCPAPD